MAAQRLVIGASPAAGGRCERAAQTACDLLRCAYPEDEVRPVLLSRARIGGCIGCNRCAKTGACFMRDDMDGILPAFEVAAELFIVSPLYFAGPPSQLKALFDRLQPYYWAWLSARGSQAPKQPKRPARLLVVGAGGDPHGFEPLRAIAKSALAVAGFSLEGVVPVIGGGEADVMAAVPAWLGCAGKQAPDASGDDRFLHSEGERA